MVTCLEHFSALLNAMHINIFFFCCTHCAQTKFCSILYLLEKHVDLKKYDIQCRFTEWKKYIFRLQLHLLLTLNSLITNILFLTIFWACSSDML